MTTLLTYSLPLEKQKLKNQIIIREPANVKQFSFYDHYAEIQENIFDCGCLILGYVDSINKEFQDQLEAFMHQNGYSKVLFTVSINDRRNISIWTDLGYIAIDTGRSSRHPEHTIHTFLLYKVIEPEFKGYV
jgi:hypothetical protein